MKSAVYRRAEELSETPTRKGPEVFHDLSSNYSLNIQFSLKNSHEEMEFFRALTYFVRVLKKLSELIF